MMKALLIIALALATCQAMPAEFSLGSEPSRPARELAERMFHLDQHDSELNMNTSILPVRRHWMESTNGTVVPLFTVKRELIREWMKLSNETEQHEQDEEIFVKRIFTHLKDQDKREFEELAVNEFEQKKDQFRREFEEPTEDLSKRGFEWTHEAKRVWKESTNGSVVPVKRSEWEQLLNESVVVPVKRESLEQWSPLKREFDLKAPISLRLLSEEEPEFRSERLESSEFTKAFDLIRNSRSLSEAELRSLNETEFVKLCDGSSSFKYYQSHPLNESLYIQCDPWGQPIVKACEQGLVWDQWKLRCCTPENVRNSTLAVGYDFDLLNAVQALFDCNIPQYTCVNGGVCSKLSTGYKCVCSGNFTGDLCEIKVDASSIYSEILSNQFHFEQYRERLAAERPLDDLKFFEQYKDLLSQSTYDELVRYLSSYKKGEVRYDRLVSNLIEDVLLDIYPDAFYLSVFNASSETVANVVRMVPNLISYTKYSSERYVQVFYQYTKTLEKLVAILNSSWPSVQREATDYYKLTSVYLNNSIVLSNTTLFDDRYNVSSQDLSLAHGAQVGEGVYDQQEGAFSFGSRPAIVAHKSGLAGGSSSVGWTETEVKEKMRKEYNETIRDTNEFFDFLEKFRTKALVEIKRDQKLISLPLSEVNFEYVKEVIVRLDEISRSSMLVWDSLANYGFWFLTNVFATEKL